MFKNVFTQTHLGLTFALYFLTWAAPEGGARGTAAPVPLPLLPPRCPVKNFDGDKVLSGNHTRAKV